MLRARAIYIPPVAIYASNLCVRTPPKLLLRIKGGRVQVVHSRTGVEQGYNEGILCYSAVGSSYFESSDGIHP